MSRPPALALGSAIAASILAISTAAVLVRASAAGPVAVSFYRLLYATLLLLPFAAVLARKELRGLSGRDLAALLAVGAVLAVHFATWIASLAYTSVASSLFLVTLHPVVVSLASERLYGEGPGRLGYAGILVALAGGLVITLGDRTGDTGSDPLLGDLLALVGALAFAVYFLAGRRYRQRLGLLAYVTPVYAGASLTLGLLLLLLPPQLGGGPETGSLRDQAIFIALAVVPMIGGHTVLNWALRYVPAPVVSTTILGEPLGGTLLAFLLLNEAPPTGTLLGGALVLAGIAVVVLSQARRERTVDVPT